MKPLAVYVHIPFCEKRCGYSVFVSCTQTQTIDAYVMDSLLGTGELSSKFGLQAAITFFQMAIGSTLVIITNAIVRKIEPSNSLF